MLKTYPDNGKPVPPIVSSVDNGWLAAGLIMVRNCCPPLAERADSLLKPMDFGFFYAPYHADDPKDHPGQVRGPYWIDRKAFGGFNRIINTEQRIVGYIGIARGQIPAEHYYRVERTLKATEGDAIPGAGRERSEPTWASLYSKVITRIGGCGSSRAGAAACLRT